MLACRPWLWLRLWLWLWRRRRRWCRGWLRLRLSPWFRLNDHACIACPDVHLRHAGLWRLQKGAKRRPKTHFELQYLAILQAHLANAHRLVAGSAGIGDKCVVRRVEGRLLIGLRVNMKEGWGRLRLGFIVTALRRIAFSDRRDVTLAQHVNNFTDALAIRGHPDHQIFAGPERRPGCAQPKHLPSVELAEVLHLDLQTVHRAASPHTQ